MIPSIRRFITSKFRRRGSGGRLWALILLIVIFFPLWALISRQSSMQKGQAAVVSDLFRSALIGDGHQDVAGQYAIIDQQHQSIIPVAAKCVQQYPNETIANINTFDAYKRLSTGGSQGEIWNALNPKVLQPNERLKVFVMPFTHVDPGWLETFDTYSADTNNILTYMLRFLKTHPDMRFTWCEMVFFERWWRQQIETDKADLIKLIENGQLELTSGSWTMTDEANPYFPITVDNIVEGHQFLKHELNTTAQVMWSNDPFGYGPSVPYLFSKAGVHKAVINRIHRSIKIMLQKDKAVPFIWRQQFDSTGKSDVHTYVLPFGHYDVLNSCGPNPAVCCQFDFKRMTHFYCPGPKPVPITDQNVAAKADLLIDQLKRLSSLYENNILLMILGDDFRQHYDNFIPLFAHINKRHELGVDIRFGTYSDYFRELDADNIARKITTRTVTGDFFPYNDMGGDYWTGYYTSRPFYKRRERILHAHVRAADLLSTQAFAHTRHLIDSDKSDLIAKLTMSRRNLSLFQHHDAITGTSRVNVMDNYGRLMFDALKLAYEVIERSLSSMIMGGKHQFKTNEYPIEHNASNSRKPLLLNEGQSIIISVYNSLPYEIFDSIDLLVNREKISVRRYDDDAKSPPIAAQIDPYLNPAHGVANNLYQLIFHAKLLPLANTLFIIAYDRNPTHTTIAQLFVASNSAIQPNTFPSIFKIEKIDDAKLSIKTVRVETNHDPISGFLQNVRIGGNIRNFSNNFWQYKQTRSGPYIFAPGAAAQEFPSTNAIKFVSRGALQQTITVYMPRLYHTLTIREIDDVDGEHLHMSTTVDLSHIGGNIELVTRFTTDLNLTERVFYTDSIGLQMMKREAHQRVGVEANYYPMPTGVFVEDDHMRVSIISNLPHGVTSPQPGQLEIMLDRSLMQDDSKGLGFGPNSVANDNRPVTIAMTIVFESVNDNHQLPPRFAYQSSIVHSALQSLLYRPLVLHTEPTTTLEITQNKSDPPTITALPCDYQLLTVRSLPSHQSHRLIILFRAGIDCTIGRRASMCTASDDDINSSIRVYLSSIGVTRVLETTLAGVAAIGIEQTIDSIDFRLEPMDFRAFRFSLST